jgi:cell division initiation protein
MMKITPLDIQQREFKGRFRGYDREEVQAFLRSVSQTVEEMLKENIALKEHADKLYQEVGELRKKDASLNELLVTTQTMAESLKEAARKEADLILREAEMKAEDILKSAHVDFRTLQRDLLDLRKERVLALEKLRSMLQSFAKVIELEEMDVNSMMGEGSLKNIAGGR